MTIYALSTGPRVLEIFWQLEDERKNQFSKTF